MIDLVEQAKPGDLESAGEALLKARGAIAAAAEELGQHIDRVDWEGEAGQAFRKWGKNLVKDTHKLSDFADAAGVHMASAGAGLASVRASMPPRDNRADPKTVKDIPSPKRVEGNEEYAAAVKAEKHRQEAINQMNRLASFYLVSQEGMARQEPPVFSAMPKVGVPRPERTRSLPGGGEPNTKSTTAPAEPRSPLQPLAEIAPTGSSDRDAFVPPREHGQAPTTSPVRSVGTEIDSVDTLPPLTTGPAPTSQPSSGGPVAHDVTPVPLLGRNRYNPVLNAPTPRISGPPGLPKNPTPPQGRTGWDGPAGQGGSRGQGPLGPAGPNGRQQPPGRSVGGPAGPGQPPGGRSVAGGTPRPLGAPRPSQGGPAPTGAVRSQGVVGGRPLQGPVPNSPSSRAPRGPDMNAQKPRTPAQGFGVDQRGVVGVRPQEGGSRQTPRPATVNPGGVVGAPKGLTVTNTGRRGGFTTGGTGLVRGSTTDSRRSEEEEEEIAQRSDLLGEDEQTQAPSGPRPVPPVVN